MIIEKYWVFDINWTEAVFKTGDKPKMRAAWNKLTTQVQSNIIKELESDFRESFFSMFLVH